MKKVNLNYFGDRNYIDISTLSKGFYAALGLNHNSEKIQYEAVHIKKRVDRHGHLIEGIREDYCCLFETLYAEKKHTYSFFQSEEKISQRIVEPPYILKDLIEIIDTTAVIKGPVNSFMTYNLMVYGKALIVRNTELIPRVVRTELLYGLQQQDYSSLEMKLKFLKNNFLVLNTLLNGKKHGSIFVKLISS